MVLVAVINYILKCRNNLFEIRLIIVFSLEQWWYLGNTIVACLLIDLTLAHWNQFLFLSWKQFVRQWSLNVTLRRYLYCIWKFHCINWRFDGRKLSWLATIYETIKSTLGSEMLSLFWLIQCSMQIIKICPYDI